MTAARKTQSQSLGGARARLAEKLDQLLRQSIGAAEFDNAVAQACEADPEEIWTVLALLDQYHRLGKLPTEQFRALKAAADRRGLGRRGLPIPGMAAATTVAERAPAAEPAAAAPPSPSPSPSPSAATATATPTPAATPTPRVIAIAPAVAALAVPPIDVPTLAPAAAIGVGSLLRGRYLLEAEIAHDERGTIYRAADQLRSDLQIDLPRVALLVLNQRATGSAVAMAELLQEFREAQRLAHPNIVKVREVDQDGAAIFITMDLVNGEPLSTVLARRQGRALPRATALVLIRDIGAALVHAHDHGVVHGDLRPECILIAATGEVRIRGFGALQSHSPYASCEQLEGRVADRRDDLYSLACIGYELLAGRHPFAMHNAAAARGRNLVPVRPMLLTRTQWQALRIGLAWRRENRTVGVAWWLARMRLPAATKRLPALEALATLPAPRRPLLRPLLLVSLLGATLAAAGSYRGLPPAATLDAGWRALSVAVTAAPQLLQRVGDWLSPREAPATSAVAVAAATRVTVPTARPAAAVRRRLKVAAIDRPSAPAQAPVAEAPAVDDDAADAMPAAALAAANGSAAVPQPARIELSADNYTVLPGESAAHIVVRRRGALQGDVSFVWWTEAASAAASRDYIDWGRRAEQIPAGHNSVTLLVPIVSDAARRESRLFYVMIGAAGGGAELGSNARAAVLMPGGG